MWSAFGTSPVGSRVTSLLLIDSTLLAATNGGLLRYATAGAPWASANVSADPAAQVSDAFNVVNSLYTDGVTIFAATGNNGVFVAPYGTSFLWTPFSGSGDTALPSLEVRSLRGSGTTLYASTRAGVRDDRRAVRARRHRRRARRRTRAARRPVGVPSRRGSRPCCCSRCVCCAGAGSARRRSTGRWPTATAARST